MAANRNVRSTATTSARRYNGMRRKINNSRYRRNIRKAKPSSSTSIGGLVATGVRTLTSFIPGQTIVRPVVDTLLKALGFITNVTFLNSENIVATLRPIGLSCNIPLNFGNLMCESKNFGVQGINSQGMPVLTTNYDTGRILKLFITAEPTAKQSEKSGDWAMAIVPLKQIADQSALESVIPNFEDLKNVPGAKYGPANRPLSVLWIPNVARDSTAAMNQNFGNYTGFCFLMLAYSQEARDSYGNFTPDTFSVRFTTKTFAHFDERLPMSSFGIQGASAILQPNAIKPQSHYIGTYKGKKYQFTDDHVVSTEGSIKLKINKVMHSDLFAQLKTSILDEDLIDEYDRISMRSD